MKESRLALLYPITKIKDYRHLAFFKGKTPSPTFHTEKKEGNQLEWLRDRSLQWEWTLKEIMHSLRSKARKAGCCFKEKSLSIWITHKLTIQIPIEPKSILCGGKKKALGKEQQSVLIWLMMRPRWLSGKIHQVY